MKTIIRVRNVTMKFNMTRDKIDSIKEYFIKFVKKQLHYEEFTALNDVSFNIDRGESVGIIGLNGSGKSTTLKIISGILKPTAGTVKVYGTVSPLIELGAGFDFDLTARENVFLNGAVLGYSHAEMLEEYNSIISFAELEEFQDVSIKNFSSGMIARLGFAIATITKPDILIVDEILGVGDFLFQQKCEKRIASMMDGGTTVLVVSHSITQIKRLCTRAIWLSRGRVVMDGPSEEVCAAYLEKAEELGF